MTAEETAVRVRMQNVVFDRAEPARLAQFWSAVTGFQPKEGEPHWDDAEWKDAEFPVAVEQSGGSVRHPG